MNGHSSYRWLSLTLIILGLLTVAIFYERTGLSYDSGKIDLTFLDPLESAELGTPPTATQSSTLLLFDQNGIEGPAAKQTAAYALESMRVIYDAVDVNSGSLPDLYEYSKIIIAFTDLDKIDKQVLSMLDWVNEGGRLLFAIRPNPSHAFTSIYRKMGIVSKNDVLVDVRGVKFTDDLFPGAEGMSFGEDFLNHDSLPVQLEANCRVHMVSADQYALPIFWEYDYGAGRVVVLNSDQFANKSARGMIAASFSLLDDVFVYPVINSAMFFIDDFPSPIPAGENEHITREFGRNLNSFYVNIWWPDMQSFARRYGIKYTGLIIETYEDVVDPPFNTQTDVELFNYLGNSLLRGGGEIGWHGYNHVPLCMKEAGLDPALKYPSWPSEEAMRDALDELVGFGNSLYGEQPFTSYVPPSNILCPEARSWLPQALPGLRVIASVYLPDNDQSEYAQEFMEADDGVIELPRIFAGYLPNDFMRWTAVNELTMHYVHSQFLHPDDILDEERSGGKGWAQMRSTLEDYLLWLYRSVPHIRNMTAREGAMAVQRYARLGVESGIEEGEYKIYLDNFYDEAYLLMRSSFEPHANSGAEITQIGSSLYLIKALEAEITLQFVEGFPDIPVTGKTPGTKLMTAEPLTVENTPLPKAQATLPADRPLIAAETLSRDFTIGEKVQVSGTEGRGLRMRKQPGLTHGASFIAGEGEIFTLIEGPQREGDLVWWRLQSESNPTKDGWSVEEFLALYLDKG